MCLGNISAKFSANNITKTRLDGSVFDFSLDCRAFDTSNIIVINKYSMKKHNIKPFLG